MIIKVFGKDVKLPNEGFDYEIEYNGFRLQIKDSKSRKNPFLVKINKSGSIIELNFSDLKKMQQAIDVATENCYRVFEGIR